MSVALKEVQDRALKLPARSRARLAERLIASLDEVTDPDAEKLWVAEAERRVEELESGKLKRTAEKEVLRRARSLIK